MGTRAIISKNDKPFIATHWDGYPDCLGEELMKTKTDAEIIKICKRHGIDAADKSILDLLNEERYKTIVARAHKEGAKRDNGKPYTVEYLKQLNKKGKALCFGVQCPEDYPITDIKDYGDWAEYQYDLNKGKWRFRPLNGSWDDNKTQAKFKPLTLKNCRMKED